MSVLVMHQNDKRPMDTIKVVNPKTGNSPMIMNEIDFIDGKHIKWEDFIAEVESLVQKDVDAENAEIEAAKIAEAAKAETAKASAKKAAKEPVISENVKAEAVPQEKNDTAAVEKN